MRTVNGIADAGTWDRARTVDRVVLDAGDRVRRRIVLTTEGGMKLLLDFAEPMMLRDGDGLVLDDGSIVAVAGQTEPLVEVSAKAPADFVRLAWHIGNRHTDIQFVHQGFRIRRDHVLEGMLCGLGASMMAVDALFDPEAVAPHGHHHDHGHGA
jgi:urease accessory protein